MKPVYSEVLRKSGVLEHPDPVVYDMAGGGGILRKIASEVHGKEWPTYFLADTDSVVLKKACQNGVKYTFPWDIRESPLKPDFVDHAFLLFPTSGGAFEEALSLEETARVLKGKGRVTLLGPGGPTKHQPKVAGGGGLKLVVQDHIHLNPAQVKVLKSYEDFGNRRWKSGLKSVDWAKGLRLLVYEKVK